MADPIQFTDGAGYERYMGKWSQLAGKAFLDWLAAPTGWRWLDVGCGNGAFTEMIVGQCAPESVHGIDPSDAQLCFARSRPQTRGVEFRQGSAMALPYGDRAFDAAVMPLVIVFLPDPAKGVREMSRVVRSGGGVAAYMWGQADGGFPYHTLQAEMAALGAEVLTPPSPEAARVDTMEELWTAAGLRDISTHQVTVERTFTDFDEYLTTIRSSPSLGRALAAMSATDVARLEERLRRLLSADAEGRITYSARANCVKGWVR